VIATSSAKHTATKFIQKNRPKDKTTLFAAGKGSSSIIRALEEQYI
jgi:glycerate-2-kinase